MDPSTTEAHIRELESVRKQINLWRGGTASSSSPPSSCVSLLYSDAKALATAGTGAGAVRRQGPRGAERAHRAQLKETMGNTLTEMQPDRAGGVHEAQRARSGTHPGVARPDRRAPEVPAREGHKILDETFNQAMKDQEPEIQQMFPTRPRSR